MAVSKTCYTFVFLLFDGPVKPSLKVVGSIVLLIPSRHFRAASKTYHAFVFLLPDGPTIIKPC